MERRLNLYRVIVNGILEYYVLAPNPDRVKDITSLIYNAKDIEVILVKEYNKVFILE